MLLLGINALQLSRESTRALKTQTFLVDDSTEVYLLPVTYKNSIVCNNIKADADSN